MGHLVEILHADQLAGEMQQMAALLRPEQLHDDGRGGLHILHRVIAIGFFQPRPRPAIDRQRRRLRRIEHRRFEMAREDEPRVELERAIILVVITFEPVLAVDALLGADEAELRNCRAPRRYWRASRAASPATPRRECRRSRCPSRPSAAADSGSRPCGRSRYMYSTCTPPIQFER